jgi:multidrug efflux system membrane fusion protein
MIDRFPLARLGLLLIVAEMVTGCTKGPPQVAPPELPAVPVSKPVEHEITDYVDFTGRTDAVEAVDIRPRVSGYLVKMPFKEGAEVKKGDLLFEVDPRPYQAQLDQAKAQVELYKAQYQLAKATYERDVPLLANRAISPQELDQAKASVDEAAARIKAYEASLEVYKLNLDFTKITSPIDGQVSRYYLTLGNLVNQDQTLLTTVVSLDPIYAYFEMDEPTVLRIRRAINEGKIQPPENGVSTLLMGLQGEEGYPHVGTVNFVNNQVNPTTGSISVRGVFPNPKPERGNRVLAPGMFARIRLPVGRPHKALLVIDRAIGSDQGLKYVYVLDADNKVQQRRITTGALQDDGLRVINDGLKPDDWVVVGGLLQIRPRAEVKAERIPMPSLTQPATGDKPPPEAAPKTNTPKPQDKTPAKSKK